MKKLSNASLLALLLVACATTPGAAPRAASEPHGQPPGGHCEYDDQCASGICNEDACRGPTRAPRAE